MRKILLTLLVILFFAGWASAQIQYMPDFQLGLKAGANFSGSSSSGDYSTKGQTGYLGGIYARIGGAGLIFQPELYVLNRNFTLTNSKNDNDINTASFTSLDLPLLVGGKFGTYSFGGRLYTGPVLSYTIAKRQTFENTTLDDIRLDYQDQYYAWQFGGGLDIKDLSIDVRYEAGLSKIGYGPLETLHTKVNLINVTLSYSLFTAFDY